MTPVLRIVLCLALVSAGTAFPQPTSEVIAAPVAHAYVGTSQGTEMYNVASNGELTLVKGSPFKTLGFPVGSNGKYLITLSTNELYSYLVESNGTIGKQISALNTRSYKGAACDAGVGTSGAELDQTGQNVYVLLQNDNGSPGNQCTAIQTFAIAKDTGELKYSSTVMVGGNNGILLQLPALISNDTYGYATNAFSCCEGPPEWSGFKRESNGELENYTFNSKDPKGGYVPFFVTTGPGRSIAAITATNSGPDDYGPEQIASYSVGGNGDISSSNTAAEMPVVIGGDGSLMSISPSAKLLAVAGFSSGLQIFHFNGTEPATKYSKELDASSGFSSIYWDDNNHLYALSFADGKKPGQLFVYTVTPTSLTEAPGSPHNISDSPQALVIVPIT
jgi:hypothetical protein